MNIAKILENFPKDTILYTPTWGEVKFVCVERDTIKCIHEKYDIMYFYSDGKYVSEGEVVLFPSKEIRDWNLFNNDYKTGDVIILENPLATGYSRNMAIFKNYDLTDKSNLIKIHCQFDANGEFIPRETTVSPKSPKWIKATTEEQETFFKRLKEEGYCWDGQKLIKNKFDINTFKPYDKVLVYDTVWYPDIISYVSKEPCSTQIFTIGNVNSKVKVIPFEGNQCLIGTSNKPNKYYRYWE